MSKRFLKYDRKTGSILTGKNNVLVGETTVMGETLTWDGNTEGRESFWANEDAEMFFITDAVPTIEQFKQWLEDGKTFRQFFKPINGGELNDRVDNGEFSLSYLHFSEMYKCAYDNFIRLQFEDAYEDGTLVYKKGTYLAIDHFYECYTAELQIPGFNGFERTEIKKIPAEYLPTNIMELCLDELVENVTVKFKGGNYTAKVIEYNDLAIESEVNKELFELLTIENMANLVILMANRDCSLGLPTIWFRIEPTEVLIYVHSNSPSVSCFAFYLADN